MPTSTPGRRRHETSGEGARVSRLPFVATPIAGLQVVTRQPRGDARGLFERLFCADELRDAGWTRPLAQVNRSRTARSGTVRGLHFQHAPHAETKLVSCLRGEVWDVALDLRRGSPTFLQWFGTTLSEANGQALLIPPGCAHGFQALSDDAELLYCHDAAYEAKAEDGVHPLDPRIDVRWPLPMAGLSERDAGRAYLAPDFDGVPT
ncbi:MAG: dTDP-4-dehydrorhamnose 3,5-epimerase family protein [Rubrivivax sp.]|nr:dTDP-4-dehydrorhamnose 3,5-epimerase family protein [Rubrivivax sp.]